MPNIVPLTAPTTMVLQSVCEHRIIVADSSIPLDMTNYGASSNRQGLKFIAPYDASGSSAIPAIFDPNDVEIERITGVPNWGATIGTTRLLPITNDGKYKFISSISIVDCEKPIKGGTLKAGNTYKILVAGATDLSAIHGWTSNYVNHLINVTTDITPSWDGVTTLTLTKEVENNLVHPQDLGNYKNNYYGTDVNAPTSVMRGNRLYVYSNNEFNINKVYLTYARIPGKVSNMETGYNVTSELTMHTLLASAVVQRIAGVEGNQNYRTIINEYKDVNKNI